MLNEKINSFAYKVKRGYGINGKYEELLFIGRKASASPATGIANRHAENQANILKLAIEAEKKEIEKHKDGVTLVKFNLPIE